MLGFSLLIWWVVTTVVYEGSLVGLLLSSTQGAKYFMFQPHEIPAFWLKLNLAPGLGLIFLLGAFVAGIKTLQIILDGTHRLLQKALVVISLLPLVYFIFGLLGGCMMLSIQAWDRMGRDELLFFAIPSRGSNLVGCQHEDHGFRPHSKSGFLKSDRRYYSPARPRPACVGIFSNRAFSKLHSRKGGEFPNSPQ